MNVSTAASGLSDLTSTVSRMTTLGDAPAPAEPVPDSGRAGLGSVFTRPWVAGLVLDLAGYTPDKDLAASVAVEPACGHGAFAVPMAERLMESAARTGTDPMDLGPCISAYDLDEASIRACRRSVEDALVRSGANPTTAQFLAARWIRHGDFLLEPAAHSSADYVVGNPPYVRLEDVPDARYARYRVAWPSMRGRADVYVGFFEAGLRSLRPGGRLAYICADRWMHAQYGAQLRQIVEDGFAMRTVLRMHDTDAFHETVTAYPAVTVVARGTQGPVLVADAPAGFDQAQARTFVRDHARGPSPRLMDSSSAWLPSWYRGGGWPATTPSRLAVLGMIEQTFPPIEATGVKIGVGVATGADKVFITTSPPPIEPDRLLRLAMAADAAGTAAVWSGSYLVNPWGPNGLVDLDECPLLAAYLREHETVLRRRRVAQDRPHVWWRTIDRVSPTLAATPKLVVPDIRPRIQPALDPGNLYPQHNLAHVTGDAWDLRVLGGLLLSDVANIFIDAYSPKMANGYRRVTTQYLRRVRVPPPASITPRLGDDLAAAFAAGDRAAATEAALAAYHLPQDALR